MFNTGAQRKFPTWDKRVFSWILMGKMHLPGGYENVRGSDVRIPEVVELLVYCPSSVTFTSRKFKLETFLRWEGFVGMLSSPIWRSLSLTRPAHFWEFVAGSFNDRFSESWCDGAMGQDVPPPPLLIGLSATVPFFLPPPSDERGCRRRSASSNGFPPRREDLVPGQGGTECTRSHRGPAPQPSCQGDDFPLLLREENVLYRH